MEGTRTNGINAINLSDDFIIRIILVCINRRCSTQIFAAACWHFGQDYLKRKRFFSAVCALEEDSGWTNQELGKVIHKEFRRACEICMSRMNPYAFRWQELGLLRRLVLGGQWPKAEVFLKPLESTSPSDYAKVSQLLNSPEFRYPLTCFGRWLHRPCSPSESSSFSNW